MENGYRGKDGKQDIDAAVKGYISAITPTTDFVSEKRALRNEVVQAAYSHTTVRLAALSLLLTVPAELAMVYATVQKVKSGDWDSISERGRYVAGNLFTLGFMNISIGKTIEHAKKSRKGKKEIKRMQESLREKVVQKYGEIPESMQYLFASPSELCRRSNYPEFRRKIDTELRIASDFNKDEETIRAIGETKRALDEKSAAKYQAERQRKVEKAIKRADAAYAATQNKQPPAAQSDAAAPNK
jgi:ribosomal protein S18